MECSHRGALLVIAMIQTAGLHATPLCFPDSRVVTEGQAAKIMFNLQNEVSDFTVTKYEWGDNKRGQDIIFWRRNETCVTYMEGVFCRVANTTVVSMEFPAATRHHQGRYVGMLTGQKEQQFCDLNVTGPACTSSCTIRQSPPTVTCGFQHLEDKQVDMSFVVKSSSGDVLADCPCELNNCWCFSKRRGSSWNASVTVNIKNSWTAEFAMDIIMNKTDYVCDLFSYNVPSKKPCHVEDGERYGQGLAIATAVLSTLSVIIFVILLIKLVLDKWRSIGENQNQGATLLWTVILSLACQLIVCILAIASATS